MQMVTDSYIVKWTAVEMLFNIRNRNNNSNNSQIYLTNAIIAVKVKSLNW